MSEQPVPSEQELFELCRSVYEATGWDETDKYWMPEVISSPGPIDPGQPMITDNWFPMVMPKGSEIGIPLYTSDYLLEKLQGVMTEWDIYLAPNPGVGWYLSPTSVETNLPRVDAATPRIALLKLTLALHKEGLLS